VLVMKKYGWMMVRVLGIGIAMSLSAYGAEKKGERGGDRHGPAGDPEARFKALDTDGNGTVSLAEFKAGHEKRMAAMKERMGDKFDASKAPNPDEIFKKIDANSDGQATKEEMKNAGPGAGGQREGGRRGRAEGAPKADASK
jgi:hypothetical protein